MPHKGALNTQISTFLQHGIRAIGNAIAPLQDGEYGGRSLSSAACPSLCKRIEYAGSDGGSRHHSWSEMYSAQHGVGAVISFLSEKTRGSGPLCTYHLQDSDIPLYNIPENQSVHTEVLLPYKMPL